VSEGIVFVTHLQKAMDSINRQQPEDNREDLQGADALKKIKELTGKASSCFFCTSINEEQPFITRPMAVQKVDEDGALWFLSANDSYKNSQIASNPVVQLLFQGASYSDFLHLTGVATITEDKQKIKELWNPFLKVWFTGGEDDPRISAIKVDPVEGYYWDTKHNKIIVTIKRLVGAITGKTLDDSIEGNITV
jgi:general stress protein 26